MATAPSKSAPVPHAPAPAADAAPSRLQIGEYLGELRRQMGWTLSEVARRTGVSISTLSKLENNQTAPAYSILIKLSEGLDIEFGALLGEAPSRSISSARAVTPAGKGKRYASEMGRYEALATDLAAKCMEPMIVEIPPDGRPPGRIRSRHEGEEFVYVLSGEVIFEMDPYAPRRLATGDSVYFDGRASHGFSAPGPEAARILSICQVRRGASRLGSEARPQPGEGPAPENP